MNDSRFSVRCATITGVDAQPVMVEVAITTGLPGFSIVGMPDAAIQEARERIRAAIKACGFSMPPDKVVVNLAPGSLKKTGSGFDLPIAAAILAATRQIDPRHVADALLVGELSLEGFVKPVAGMIAYRYCAARQALRFICAPCCLEGEGILSNQVECVASLGTFRGDTLLAAQYHSNSTSEELPDFADVGGCVAAKRACQIAAAGGHGLMMIGPPGSGKSMLAERLASILPPLEEEERIEAARIHSIAGTDISSILAGRRPFRAPYHSATMAGLVGGGNPVRPGEVTLAHGGVLFLDEMPEFHPSVLQSIRQPMETGKVVITRACGTITMPAHFMLVGASNPCPCGYYGDAKIACTCTPTQVQSYQNRIGGPILDRFDLCIDVWRSAYDEIVSESKGISSAQLREGVITARTFAFERWRQQGGPPARNVGELIGACALTDEAACFLRSAADSCALSGRGIMKVVAVARTIADIAEDTTVSADQVAEALSFRVRTQMGKGVSGGAAIA